MNDELCSLRQRILDNSANAAILEWLQIDGSSILQKWDPDTVSSGFDEGGQIFFEEWGREIPNDHKFAFGICNVMADPLSGRIFAVHRGRFTFLVRASLFSGVRSAFSETLDGPMDISRLESDWSFIALEDEERHINLAFKN